MKQSTILVFEATGWETDYADNLSCRIRTRFKVPDGRIIYLEIMAINKTKYSPKCIQNSPYEFLGTVMHALTEDERGYDERVISELVNNRFLYTKEGIVKYVNDTFGTDYQDLETTAEIHVHSTEECLC